jgi:hypothetical protein
MLLTTLSGLLVALMVLVFIGIYLILSHQKRGQSQCDEMSLTLSKLLNSHDRMGQMNSVVERSRELVYLSRQSNESAADLGVPAYEALAYQFLEESRDSARLVDKERQNQINYAVSECRRYIVQQNQEAAGKPQGIFILPWFFEARPEITQVKFGSIKDTLSSTESPKVLADLHKFDMAQDFVERTSNLYRGNINAKLPSPDDDLSFHFSTLPAEVKSADSPARLIETPPRLVNPDVFSTTALVFDRDFPTLFQRPSELPGAVQVLSEIGINTDKNTKLKLQIVSGATACSALEAP